MATTTGPKKGTSAKDSENVQVVVRCRPMNGGERERNEVAIVSIDSRQGSVTVKDPQSDDVKKYTFDSTYGPDCTQQGVFDETARPIVDSVLSGYNGTIFCYGQTGTGKTHTMEGVIDDPQLRGLMPNSFNYIFAHISSCPASQSFMVRASFLEIYKDDVFDLLNAEKHKKMEVKEDKEKGVFVKDLSTYTVHSVEDLMKVLKVGQKQRRVGATKMNAGSSRSHSILTVIVESSETISGPSGASKPKSSSDGGNDKDNTTYRMGKLHLVDLAGSERQKKTEAQGDRLEEAKSINWSLTVLGNCIKALITPNSSHVPYRDSKLTRLLQDSLGGNTKTMMIANIGPAASNHEETLSTLRYADRAKQIKNKPVVNEDAKDAMMRQMQEEIQRLKDMLEAKRRGVNIAPGAYAMGTSGMRGSAAPGNGDGSIVGVTDLETVQDISSLPPELVEERIIEKVVEKSTGITEEDVEKVKHAERIKTTEVLAEATRAKEDLSKVNQELVGEAALLKVELDDKNALLTKQELEVKRIEEALAQKAKALMLGGEQVEKARLQQLQLQKTEEELRLRREQQAKLLKDLQDAERAENVITEQYSTLQEEIDKKTATMKKVFVQYQEKKKELQAVQEEFNVERADLVDTVRELARTLKLKTLLVSHFIPPAYVQLIEKQAAYNDLSDEWQIRGGHLSGNSVERSRREREGVDERDSKPVTVFYKNYDKQPPSSSHSSGSSKKKSSKSRDRDRS